MDQIYIPKSRPGLAVGSYVVIKPLETAPKEEIKPFFYNIKHLELIKTKIINDIFRNIEALIRPDNIIITGSFLDEGFKFNDIDVIIVSEDKINVSSIKKILENNIGAKFHIIAISNKALLRGISTDPLYKSMLSKCVAMKRYIYKSKPKISYKLLDLHLLKSKLMIENFDFLTGDEKYVMTRNLIAINLFINKKDVTKDKVDLAINKLFGDNTVQRLKDNTILKKDFLVRYKKIYKQTQNKILKGIKNEPEQK